MTNKETEQYENEDSINILKLNSQIAAVYRLVSNTTRRIERQLGYIESKQNKILDLICNKDNLDPRQREILELENRLNKLRKEN